MIEETAYPITGSAMPFCHRCAVVGSGEIVVMGGANAFQDTSNHSADSAAPRFRTCACSGPIRRATLAHAFVDQLGDGAPVDIEHTTVKVYDKNVVDMPGNDASDAGDADVVPAVALSMFTSGAVLLRPAVRLRLLRPDAGRASWNCHMTGSAA